MNKNIVVIQGHPDHQTEHLCHALGDAYMLAARQNNHLVDTIDVGAIDFPLITSQQQFEDRTPPACIAQAQRQIEQADHLVIVYPLWLGTMPAKLKGFFEQVFRYEFAFTKKANNKFEKNLKGRSARLVLTMGMPGQAYRWFYQAHSLKSLERNVLKFSGIGPIQHTIFGQVDEATAQKSEQWINTMKKLGRNAV